MKGMNNKGFTLVELLAVLVILITILTIAIPSITSSIDRNKEKILNKKIDIIEAAAETYVNLYKNNINNYNGFETGSCCIDIDAIKDRGILSNDDLKDVNDNDMHGLVCLNGTKYEYCEDDDNDGKCDNNTSIEACG